MEMYSSSRNDVRVVLNPVDFEIPDTTVYDVYVYVIAEDKSDADRLSTYNRTYASVPARAKVFVYCLFFYCFTAHAKPA